MCIRDSRWPNRTVVVECEDLDQMIVAIEAGADSVLLDNMSPEPVSYTHLRAHETVLDIVCRLLLEKKKNKPPPDI